MFYVRVIGVALLAIVILSATVAFFLTPAFEGYARLWDTYLFGPLKLDTWPAGVSLPVIALFLFLPLVLIGTLIALAVRPLMRRGNPSEYYKPSVQTLEFARQNVLETVSGFHALAQSIDESLRRYEDVHARFEEAINALRESASELKRRIDFIYRETRFHRWIIALISFALGVAAKMTADYALHLLKLST